MKILRILKWIELCLATFLLTLALTLAICSLAHAQGTTNNQTVATPALFTGSLALGRTIVPTRYLIGSGTGQFVYCQVGPDGPGLQIIAEASFDQAIWFQAAPAAGGIATSLNGKYCGVIQIGGYYPYYAINIISNASADGITAWYSAELGPVPSAPAATSGASGPISSAVCNQGLAAQITPSTHAPVLIALGSNRTTYLCSGLITFSGTTTADKITITSEATGCTGISSTVWSAFVVASSAPQPLPLTFNPAFPVPIQGNSICIQTGAITANTLLTLTYAQF